MRECERYLWDMGYGIANLVCEAREQNIAFIILLLSLINPFAHLFSREEGSNNNTFTYNDTNTTSMYLAQVICTGI